MPLITMGLGALLDFDGSGAIAGMNAVAGGFLDVSKMASMFAGAVFQAGQTAAKFETAMLGVKAVTNTSPAEFQKLSDAALKMGAVGAYGPTEVAGAIEELAKAGFSAKNSMAALPGVLSLAAAEGIPLAKSTEIVTAALTQMGLKADQSDRVADVLARVSADSKTSVVALGTALSYTGQTAHQLGIPLEDTVAALGALSNAGIDSTRAGAGFSMMMQRLAVGPTMPKVNDEMRKLHVGFMLNKNGSVNTSATFLNLNRAMSKLSPTAALASASIIFSTRASQTALALSRAELDKTEMGYESLRSAAYRAAGAAQQMGDIRLSGFTGQVKVLGNAWEAFEIELMKGTVEGITPKITFLSELVREWTSLLKTGKFAGGAPLESFSDPNMRASLRASQAGAGAAGAALGAAETGLGLLLPGFQLDAKSMTFSVNLFLDGIETLGGYFDSFGKAMAAVFDPTIGPLGELLRSLGIIDKKPEVADKYGYVGLPGEYDKSLREPPIAGEYGKAPMLASAEQTAIERNIAEANMRTHPNDLFVTVLAPPGPPPPDTHVHMDLDGKTLSTAIVKHQQEVSDRAGYRSKKWSQKVMIEQGAALMGSD